MQIIKILLYKAMIIWIYNNKIVIYKVKIFFTSKINKTISNLIIVNFNIVTQCNKLNMFLNKMHNCKVSQKLKISKGYKMSI